MAEAFAREVLHMWVRKEGIPDTIISHKDSHCMSDLWGSLPAQPGTKCFLSSICLLQMYGQRQNLNAVIKCYLNMYMAQCPKE